MTAIFLLSTIAMTVLGLALVRPLVKVLQISRTILMPVVFALCCVGSFAVSGRMFDVHLMFLFGILGYFMRRNDFPAAPMVLGFILGPMADDNFRRAMIITGGDITPFFTRPLSVVLWLLTLAVVLSRSALVRGWLASLARRRSR